MSGQRERETRARAHSRMIYSHNVTVMQFCALSLFLLLSRECGTERKNEIEFIESFNIFYMSIFRRRFF